MTNELAGYDNAIAKRINQIVDCFDGLSPEQLNWRPSVEGGNSIYALTAHTLGNARAWIIGIAAGEDIGRDRPGEFAASGTDAQRLRDEAASLLTTIHRALAAMDPARLDVRLIPSQELWGEGQTPAHEISVRQAVLQVIEHASLHLGHIHLTRDLILARA